MANSLEDSDDVTSSESLSDDSQSQSDDSIDYETFLFGKAVKPTYIEREHEIQKEDVSDYNEDLYDDNLSTRFDRMGEIRNMMEAEVMSLISSLLIREPLSVSTSAPEDQKPNFSNIQLNHEALKKSNKNPASLIASNIIKNIFKDKNKQKTITSTAGNVPNPTLVINSITPSPQALDSLQNLNVLLQRERGNVFHEADGIMLSQHPRFVSMYFLENRIFETHLLPLLDAFDQSSDDITQNKILGETLNILNQLLTPPSREWIEYWSEFDRLIKKNESFKLILKHPEYIRQADLLHKYAVGLSFVKKSLTSGFYNSIFHLRLEIQNWRYNGYRTEKAKIELESLKAKESELIAQRDAINEEEDDSTDSPSEENRERKRLKRNKVRAHEINTELLQVQKKILKDADEVRGASLRADMQCTLIRNCIYNLTKFSYSLSQSENISPLIKMCSNEEITLLDIFLQEFLDIIKNPSVQMGLSDYTGSRIAYIHHDHRAKLWEFVHLIHALMMSIPNENGSKTIIPEETNLKNRNKESDSRENWMNPRSKRIKMAQLSKEKIHYRNWFIRRKVKIRPFDPIYYLKNSLISSEINSSRGFKKLVEKIRSFIGIDEDFDVIHKIPLNDNSEEYFQYNLGLVINLLSYDLLRDAGEDYAQENDWKILICIHTWVVAHYTNLFIKTNEKRYRENLSPLLSEYIFVSLKFFIAQHSTLTYRLLPELFSRLCQKGTLTSKNAGALHLVFKLIATDLELIKYFSTSKNSNILDICREYTGFYLGHKLVKHIFWVLKKWSPVADMELIGTTLTVLRLLKQVVTNLEYVEYSPLQNITLSNNMDLDNEESDNEDAVAFKRVTIDNLYHKDDRQLRSGRVISSLVGILPNCLDPHINNLILCYLEEALAHGHHSICWDMPCVQSLHRLLDDKIWENPKFRWIGELAFDILEPFFLNWGSGNMFLPIELWFFKNKSAHGLYYPTSTIHCHSLLKGYAEETIDYEILSHLNFKSGGDGKYATLDQINQAISMAVEGFKSDDIPMEIRFTSQVSTIISEYFNLSDSSLKFSRTHHPLRLILGSTSSSPSSQSSSSLHLSVTEPVLSSLQLLYKNTLETVQIIELQNKFDVDNEAYFVESPSTENFSDEERNTWDEVISKLGLKLKPVSADNPVPVYVFQSHYLLVKDKFEKLRDSTSEFTLTEFSLECRALDIISLAFNKIGYDTFKRLIDKIATGAESIFHYLQMEQILDKIELSFNSDDIALCSENTALMDLFGVFGFDLKPDAIYSILRLRNVLNVSPTQLDGVYIYQIIIKYISTTKSKEEFDKYVKAIEAWEDGELTIEINGNQNLLAHLSVLLYGHCHENTIVLPALSRPWAKKIIEHINTLLGGFDPKQISNVIVDWRKSIGDGYEMLSCISSISSSWIRETQYDHDSDFDLGETQRDVEPEQEDKSQLFRSETFDLQDNTIDDKIVDEINLLYQNSLQLARRGIIKTLDRQQVMEMLEVNGTK